MSLSRPLRSLTTGAPASRLECARSPQQYMQKCSKAAADAAAANQLNAVTPQQQPN